MTPGTFLFDRQFQFIDGQKGEKIFVVLNNGSSGTYIAVKTTSKGDRYGIQYGCQILERFPNYYFVQGSCFLKYNTWVQLDAFFEFKSGKLIQKVMQGEINKIGVLGCTQATELLTCASHSEDLSFGQEKIVLQTIKSFKEASIGEAAC